MTLLHGDCREVMAGMEPNSVDALTVGRTRQTGRIAYDGGQMGHRLARCPEHGESFTTGTNAYKCGCQFVRVPLRDAPQPRPPAVTGLPLFALMAAD
jgi:hypothetical protein